MKFRGIIYTATIAYWAAHTALILALFSALCVAACGQDVTPKQVNCPTLLVVWSSPHCGPCRRFKAEYNANPEFREALQSRFRVEFRDPDVDQKTARKFGIDRVPAFHVWQSETVYAKPIFGYTTANNLLQNLAQVRLGGGRQPTRPPAVVAPDPNPGIRLDPPNARPDSPLFRDLPQRDPDGESLQLGSGDELDAIRQSELEARERAEAEAQARAAAEAATAAAEARADDAARAAAAAQAEAQAQAQAARAAAEEQQAQWAAELTRATEAAQQAATEAAQARQAATARQADKPAVSAETIADALKGAASGSQEAKEPAGLLGGLAGLSGMPAVLAASAALGVPGIAGAGIYAAATLYFRRRRRKAAEKATFPGSQPADPGGLPLPRNLAEAGQLLQLRKREGHHPLHDSLFGVLAQDELAKLIDKDAPSVSPVSLRDSILQRFNEIAPLSTNKEDFA